MLSLAGAAKNAAKKGTVSIQQACIPLDFYSSLYSHDFTLSLSFDEDTLAAIVDEGDDFVDVYTWGNQVSRCNIQN